MSHTHNPSSDHLPVEIWEYILHHAFNPERSIRPNNDDTPWSALEQLHVAETISPYAEFATQRETLRLVCRSWNTFVQSFNNSFRWIIVSLSTKSYHSTPAGLDPILPDAAVRIDLVHKPSIGPFSERFNDTESFLSQLTTYHPVNWLSFAFTGISHADQFESWIYNDKAKFAPCLQRLVLGAPRRFLDDPADQEWLPILSDLTGLTELRMRLSPYGLSNYSMKLPQLRILSLTVLDDVRSIYKDVTVWEFPLLSTVRMKMGQRVWDDIIYHVLPKASTKVRLLDLSTDKGKEKDIMRTFDLRWEDFPSLDTLALPIAGIISLYTRWERPITLIVNDDVPQSMKNLAYQLHRLCGQWPGDPDNKPFRFRVPAWQCSSHMWNEVVAAGEDYGLTITR